MSKNLIVIPARIGSTRFPKKMLHKIQGKPLIDWTMLAARRVENSRILIATDDHEIAERAMGNKIEYLMTPTDIKSGTERVSYVVKKLKFNGKIINWQGDEPLVEPSAAKKLFSLLDHHDVVTLAAPYKGDLENQNRVKVNINNTMQAIDFSRKNAFPFSDGTSPSGKLFLKNHKWDKCWEHIGIYGYRSEALLKWTKSRMAEREREEKLEQLTALKIGLKIGVEIIKSAPVGVNTIEDVKNIGKLKT